MSDSGRRQTGNNGELTEGNSVPLLGASGEVVGKDFDALLREPPIPDARLALLYSDNLNFFALGDVSPLPYRRPIESSSGSRPLLPLD